MHDIKNADEGVIIEIDRAYMHPSWEALDNYDKQDMVIYQLAEPVEFSETILPICLPNEGGFLCTPLG